MTTLAMKISRVIFRLLQLCSIVWYVGMISLPIHVADRYYFWVIAFYVLFFPLHKFYLTLFVGLVAEFTRYSDYE